MRNDLDQIVAMARASGSARGRRAVRFCEGGPGDDGRKHESDLGEVPVPFEGSSDTRIPLVDGLVQDKRCWPARRFSARRCRPSRWSRTTARVPPPPRCCAGCATAMREELETEVELSAEHMFADDPGLAIVEVCWLQEPMLQRRALTFDELAASTPRARPIPTRWRQRCPAGAGAAAGLYRPGHQPDPRGRNASTGWPAFTRCSRPRCWRGLRELRKTGATELPVPVIRENRPSVQALRHLDDVFFPVGTADLQRARHIHRREWVSETDLRERAFTLGWNADTVEEVIDKGEGGSVISGALTSTGQGADRLQWPRPDVNEQDHLFEIWWSLRAPGRRAGHTRRLSHGVERRGPPPAQAGADAQCAWPLPLCCPPARAHHAATDRRAAASAARSPRTSRRSRCSATPAATTRSSPPARPTRWPCGAAPST